MLLFERVNKVNENDVLVIINMEDKTRQIRKVYYSSSDKRWNVTFSNGRTYQYNYYNVERYYASQTIDFSGKTVVVKGDIKYGVTKIIKFDPYCKLFYPNNRTEMISLNFLRIVDEASSSRPRNPYEYLKETANYLRVSIDDDSSFLVKQYARIGEVTTGTSLHQLLSRIFYRRENLTDVLIFPFGNNISQYRATSNVFKYSVSIIEGPPGTGKTQTILNIIANALIRGHKVAITSNNNSATSNVQEKLHEYGVDFVSAFLGRKENQLQFIANQSGKYPDFSGWEVSGYELNDLASKLKNNLRDILELHELKNKQAKLNLELENLKIEFKHFEHSGFSDQVEEFSFINSLTSEQVGSMAIAILTIPEKLSFFWKLKTWFSYGLKFKDQTKLLDTRMSSYLHGQYYRMKISELEREITENQTILDNQNFDNLLKRYKILSMKYLKAFLFRKYQGTSNRTVYSSKDIYSKFPIFINDYPVILSTTYSLLNSSGADGFYYDYVIVDEASQVDLVSGGVALSQAKNVVIVGDENQLPNVVSSEDKQVTDEIFQKYSVNPYFKFSENSLLTTFKQAYRNSEVPITLLREHYRCDPRIIDFCNQKFYHGQLIIHTKNEIEDPLKVYLTTEGNHARGRYNQRQIDVIKKEILPELQKREIQEIGIITPFRDQRDQLLSQLEGFQIEADTVHKYQGRERDAIIISTVSNEIEPGSFVDNKNLINVAISRAKKQLYLVTSPNVLDSNSNISDLVSYIRYHNFEVTESQIISVFDALYRKYSMYLEEKYINPAKVSEFKSENIAHELIKSILSNKKYGDFDFVMHYPLRFLIASTESLSDDEVKFALNPLAHLDFLIYRKLDKRPIISIEVDGFHFHNQNSIQLNRDAKKDRIMSVMGVSMIRLNTTGSGEKEIIIDTLDKYCESKE